MSRCEVRGIKSPHPPFFKGGYGGIWGAKCAPVALLLIILITSNSEAVILDRVVAVVNDDVITLTEVQEEGL